MDYVSLSKTIKNSLLWGSKIAFLGNSRYLHTCNTIHTICFGAYHSWDMSKNPKRKVEVVLSISSCDQPR